MVDGVETEFDPVDLLVAEAEAGDGERAVHHHTVGVVLAPQVRDGERAVEPPADERGGGPGAEVGGGEGEGGVLGVPGDQGPEFLDRHGGLSPRAWRG
ncbi:hypothetical protein GCM10010442_36100 [Kitasatospora kifunensis]